MRTLNRDKVMKVWRFGNYYQLTIL